MMLKHTGLIGGFLILLSPLQAQELVENPEFLSWSKFKKGTSLVVKSTTSTDKETSEVIITSILIDAGPEKVVVQNFSVVKTKDKDYKLEPVKREILRLTPLPKGMSKEDFAAGKPPGTTEEGTETLKIGGQELKAKWYKYNAEEARTKINARKWFSPEIPGNIVKSEMTTTGDFASTIKLEVVELKKP
jgi:hypothetical protein